MLEFRPVLVVVAAPVLVCLRLLFNLLPVLGLGLVLLGVGGKRPAGRSKYHSIAPEGLGQTMGLVVAWAATR